MNNANRASLQEEKVGLKIKLWVAERVAHIHPWEICILTNPSVSVGTGSII